MYRRPLPGRPARQCGHPKSNRCDCLAKRTLCCTLSPEQWNLVEAGQIVRIAMYDNHDDLETAQNARQSSTPSQATPSLYSDLASTPMASTPMANESFSPASTPAPIPRLQMMGVGGPQGNAKPGPDPFAWTGEVPSFPTQNLAGQYQQMPSSGFMAPSVPMYQQFEGDYPAGVPTTDMHRSSLSHPSALQNPWPQPRPEYMPFNRPQFATAPDTSFDSLPLEQMHLSPQIQAMQTSQPFMPPSSSGQFANQAPPAFYPSLPMPIMPEFLEHDISMQEEFDASEPPNPIQGVTQSCCSSKKRPAQQMSGFQDFNYRASAPANQFPCPRCASTMCTCTNCPEVMQNASQNGAWSSACGRAGHLDANDFVPPVVPQPQQFAVPAAPVARSSCCGSKKGTPSARSSPFPEPMPDVAQWQPPPQHAASHYQGATGVEPQYQAVPTSQHTVPHYQGIPAPQPQYESTAFGNGIDPSLLYHQHTPWPDPNMH